jgi:hypothetical protein
VSGLVSSSMTVVTSRLTVAMARSRGAAVASSGGQARERSARRRRGGCRDCWRDCPQRREVSRPADGDHGAQADTG